MFAFGPKFDISAPTVTGALCHLESVVCGLRIFSHRPTAHDEVALHTVSEPRHLKDPDVRDLILRCLSFTLEGKGFEDSHGRIPGTRPMAEIALRIIERNPEPFANSAQMILREMDDYGPKLMGKALRALGPQCTHGWPPGLGARVQLLLSNDATLRDALRFLCAHARTAGDMGTQFRERLGAALEAVLQQRIPSYDLPALITTVAVLKGTRDCHVVPLYRCLTSQSMETADAALHALVVHGEKLGDILEERIKDSRFLSISVSRAVVAGSLIDPHCRKIVSRLLDPARPDDCIEIIRAIMDEGPVARRLFEAELTLLGLSTDTTPEALVHAARGALKVREESVDSDDFFSFSLGSSLRKHAIGVAA